MDRIMTEKFGMMLFNHIAALPDDTRAVIKSKVEKRTARTAADKRGKLAFLVMLDEIEKQKRLDK